MDASLVVQAQALFERMASRVPANFRSVPAHCAALSLLEGKLHAALISLPLDRRLATACLLRESLFVALPATHRLSRKQRISIRELGDDPVIWSGQETHPAFHEHLLRQFRKCGYIPNFSRETLSALETLGLVSEGVGIGFVSGAEPRLHGKGFVIRPLKEASLVVETGVAYLGENKWGLLQEFVRSLTSHFSRGAHA